jgi:hypothetical protein
MRDHRDRLSNQACGQASIDDDGDAREARRKLQGESEDDFLGSALRRLGDRTGRSEGVLERACDNTEEAHGHVDRGQGA